MSTHTKEKKLAEAAEAVAAAKADVTRITTLITAHKETEPVWPALTPTGSQGQQDHHTKNKEYKSTLARLQTQLDNATMKLLHADYKYLYLESLSKGGKKSRKSHNSKKSRKSKRSRTTYKRSRR